MIDQALTGRQLVAELAKIGVGTWSADAVRQWIREEPPCPIAEHADQGKPHRYSLAQVLAWLRIRAMAERAKGFTRGDGADLVSRIDRALSGAQPSLLAGVEPEQEAPEFSAARIAPTPGAGAAPTPKAPEPEWLQLSDRDALLEVLKGRDPRNWKAAEEAITIRTKRMEAQRELIPAPELDAALELQVTHIRQAIVEAGSALKSIMRDLVPPERTQQMVRVIDDAVTQLLSRLASDSDLPIAPGSESAAA
ncbi:MAG TPA: hypothetical protein VHE37_12030 [Nevskiaceae bacterium]|nr:hypothetical protein [Nevskiaceae bacterium]